MTNYSYTTINDPSGSFTSAQKLNNLGQFVGGYNDGSGDHGFLYSGGSYTTLDDPLATGNTPAFGITGTLAYGINDNGDIVGHYNADGSVHGFLYSGGSYTTLDDPFGTNGTLACGINDKGQIVGFYVGASGASHGLLYSGGTYTTLDDPSATNGTFAYGINATGQIVGAYNDGSGFHGFLDRGGSYTTVDDPFAAGETVAWTINGNGKLR